MSLAFAGSCSDAPSIRDMRALPPTPNTPPTAMTRPSSGVPKVIAASREVSCWEPMNPALTTL